jgi:threonine/homoserine/homoserine lactone efflux protein
LALVSAEFLAAVLVMELTPGPNMAWLALLAARSGRLVGWAAVAGIALGLAMVGVASAAGAAALLTAYPALYDIVRIGGVGMMLYLAVEAWLGGGGATDVDAGAATAFRRAVVINLLNPKAVAVFALIIPSFVPDGHNEATGTAVLTLIYLSIATGVHGLIVMFASSFQRFASDGRREKILRRLFAILLAAVAVWLWLSSGR